MDMNPNLEHDLLSSNRITEKAKNSNIYAQNLYAALCNNRFFYGDQEWTCSWRMSGGIIADIRDCGEDYMNYYCSGIGDSWGYVEEGCITDEIKLDLMMMGWTVRPYDTKLKSAINRNAWQ